MDYTNNKKSNYPSEFNVSKSVIPCKYLRHEPPIFVLYHKSSLLGIVMQNKFSKNIS